MHLAHRELDFETWYTDVVNVIEFEDLEHVILVGSSFGGFIVSGVAEQIPERLLRLVFLDAFVPQGGESLKDFTDADSYRQIRESIETEGDGWLLAPTDPFDRRFVPHPVTEKMLNARFRVSDPERRQVPCAYIRCTAKEHPYARVFEETFERVSRDPGWDTYAIATDHVPMVSEPDELTDLLLEIASRTASDAAG